MTKLEQAAMTATVLASSLIQKLATAMETT